MRKQKVLKLRYNPSVRAYLAMTASEVKMGAGDTSSLIVNETGMSVNLPPGGTFSLGTLSPVYGGIARNTSYPLSLIPGVPQQVPSLEYAPVLSSLREIASLASLMVV